MKTVKCGDEVQKDSENLGSEGVDVSPGGNEVRRLATMGSWGGPRWPASDDFSYNSDS